MHLFFYPYIYNDKKLHSRTHYFFPYLNVVQVVEQWRFLHTKVVRDQGVEAIGEIQDLGLGQRI